MYDVTERRTSEDYVHIETLLQPTLDEIDKISSTGGIGTGIPTGFHQLDEYTNGLHPGQMITVAGRPGSGQVDARPGHGPLGGGQERQADRHLLPRDEQDRDHDADVLGRGDGVAGEHALGAHERPGLDPAGAPLERAGRGAAVHRRQPEPDDDGDPREGPPAQQRHDLQMVVIDYLQLMTSGKRVESRQQEVSEFSRATKLLAKELEVPVVVLSQLNRGPEQRTDKKPMLSDLRESGSIEQDSDVVLLVHRPDLYEPETERAGEADLILAKHRNGPTATCAVAFQGRYSRFVDMPN